MNKKIILKQEHLPTKTTAFLAPMEDGHIRHLIKLARDPDLIELLGWNPFFETDETNEFIEAISAFCLPYSRKSRPVVFGVYANPEALPIGYAVFKGLNTDLQTAEVGIAILDPGYRKRGLGKLALKRIVRYGFEELGLTTIGAVVLLFNEASISMCKRAGFVVREIMHDSWPMPDGRIEDMVWFECSRQA